MAIEDPKPRGRTPALSIAGRSLPIAATKFFLGSYVDLTEGDESTELHKFVSPDLPPGSASITWDDANGRPTGLADIPANRAGWPVGAIWADNSGTGDPLLVEYDMTAGGPSVSVHTMSGIYVPKNAKQGEWGNSIDGLFYYRRGNRLEHFAGWNDRIAADMQTARSYIYTSPWDDITNTTRGMLLGITDPLEEDDADHDFARAGTVEVEVTIDGIATGNRVDVQVLAIDGDPLSDVFTDLSAEGGRTFRAFFHDPETEACQGYPGTLRFLTDDGYKAKSWKDGFKIQITSHVKDTGSNWLFPATVKIHRHLTLGGHIINDGAPPGPIEPGDSQTSTTSSVVSAQVKNYTFAAPTGNWWFYPYCFSGIDRDENGDYFALDTRNRVSDKAIGEGGVVKTSVAPKVWHFDGNTGNVLSTWFVLSAGEGSDKLSVKRDMATGGIVYNKRRREVIVGIATQDCSSEPAVVTIPCPTCELYVDGFTKGFTDWTTVNGSWVIADSGGVTNGTESKRLVTNLGNALISCDTQNPHGIPARASVHAKGVSGQKARLIINYADVDNYTAAELEWSSPCAKLRLIERAAGVETVKVGPLIMDEISPDRWARVIICHIPKEAGYPSQQLSNTGFIHVEAIDTESEDHSGDPGTRYFDTGGRVFLSPITSYSGNNKAALQIIGSGQASFDSFRYETTAVFAPASESPCVINVAVWNDLTGWREVSGSWSAASGTLTTTNENAIILDETTDTASVIVRVTITMDSDTSAARVCVGYKDQFNYWFVEVGTSGGSLRVRRGYVNAANEVIVTTEVIAGVSSTDPVDLQVFACDSQVRFIVNELQARDYVDMQTQPPGKTVALATMQNASGVDFDSYTALHHRSSEHLDCPGFEDILDCDVCRQCHQNTLKLPYVESTDETGNAFTFNCLASATGTWNHNCSSIGGGLYHCLPEGQGEIIIGSEFPHLLDVDLTNPFYIIKVEVSGSMGSAVVRIKVDYVDASNYHYAEFDWGASPPTVTIGKVVGGTDTALNTERTSGTSFMAVEASRSGHLVANSEIVDDCRVDRRLIDDDPDYWVGATSSYSALGGNQFAVDVSADDITIAEVKIYTCCDDVVLE
jgi:hypothetical protein